MGKSDLLDDKPDKLGSELGTSGTYFFRYPSLFAEYSVAGVFVSDIFAPTGIEIQRWLNIFNVFLLSLKFGILGPYFKISFIVFLSTVCNCVYNCYSLS